MAEANSQSYGPEIIKPLGKLTKAYLAKQSVPEKVGWHADPLDVDGRQRMWDGSEWTAQIRHRKGATAAPPATGTTTFPDSQGVVSRRANSGDPLTDEVVWRKKMLSNSERQTRYLQSFWWVLLIFLLVNVIVAIVVAVSVGDNSSPYG